MKLTAVEQETILNFNEGEDTASLYTYNQKLQKRFDQMSTEYPELVSRKASSCGAVTYDFSKKMLKVGFQAPLSDAEKQRRADNMRKNRYIKKANGSGEV